MNRKPIDAGGAFDADGALNPTRCVRPSAGPGRGLLLRRPGLVLWGHQRSLTLPPGAPRVAPSLPIGVAVAVAAAIGLPVAITAPVAVAVVERRKVTEIDLLIPAAFSAVPTATSTTAAAAPAVSVPIATTTPVTSSSSSPAILPGRLAPETAAL
jgi:hypothetical protein